MAVFDNSTFVNYVRSAHPRMRAATTLQGDHWRIGLLSESMVRLEWSDSGVFEDNLTQMVVNRDFGGEVRFTSAWRDGLLVVDTPYLHLTYDGKPFSKEGLSIVVGGVTNSQANTWHYGDVQRGNLGGTARTLDESDGEIPLDHGVISRDGWAVLDDSASNTIVEAAEVDGKPNPLGAWVAPREHAETDLYFFGYGHRYVEAVQDFYRLTGPTPLLPRFAFGNWWSRYYRYTQDEYERLMDRFAAEGIPFTTAVIDMDWHLVDDVDPKYGSGWTGYTWNRKLFPDHKAFLAGLHRRGLRTTLNVHPRDGVRAFEEQYEDVAKAVGIDPASGDAVEFDLTDPKFVRAYFDMHHRLEDEGVDFWWLDWQQGGVTRQPGLDPLWVLNHMHYLDSGRDGRWPLTFSRYAGPGSHRYPVGFSGDTVVSWDSLRFQPYFTATASNIGYGWWSHDIGGHMFGYRDDELEARWYQLGAFSPINRLHSTNSAFNGKEPWNFHGRVHDAMVAALRLRQALVPYLYTMNWRAALDGRPLVEPMYWQSPEVGDAYNVPDEFRFGTELVVAPIVAPDDAEVRRGKADVWLPQGTWFDFFDGRRYDAEVSGGRRIEVWRDIEHIPVFAKAGGIVPLSADDRTNNVANPEWLRVLVFPGADGRFVLREDNGVFPGSDAAAHADVLAETELSLQWRDGGVSGFVIGGVHGATDDVPAERGWDLVIRGVALGDTGADGISVKAVSPDGASVEVGDGADSVACDYDESTLSLTVHIPPVASDATVTVRFEAALADNPVERDAYAILLDAQMQYRTKETAYELIRKQGVRAVGAFSTLEQPRRGAKDFWQSHMPASVAGALTEVLVRS